MIGLVGVVVGALVTAGIAYLGDRNARMADERTAKRLVAGEIRFDTGALIVVATYGSLRGTQPRTDDWESQAATLARHVSDDVWSDVSRFYSELRNITPIPEGRCPLGYPNERPRRVARTVARHGSAAYEALGYGSIPEIGQVTKTYGCYKRSHFPIR
jgi:hypothetical protein